MTADTKSKRRIGIAATAVGCLAVIAAVLPTWLLPLVVPPEPVDKVVVDTAQKIKDRVAARVKGLEYKEPVRRMDWYQACAAAAMSLGVLAVILAAISFVTGEPWRFAGAAALLGAGAIVFQFSLLVASAIVGLLLVAIILSKLDISL